eukprot:m.76017 g.76017  ORF g.76017 m.76017 type:complete len:451 (+) comp9034_c0_seq1:384-1736(+)
MSSGLCRCLLVYLCATRASVAATTDYDQPIVEPWEWITDTVGDYVLEEENMKTPNECARVSRLPKDEAEFYKMTVLRGHPVVFENAWELYGPKLKSWNNMSEFVRKFGHIVVQASKFHANDPLGFHNPMVDGGHHLVYPFFHNMTIEEVVRHEPEDQRIFLGQVPFLQKSECGDELCEDGRDYNFDPEDTVRYGEILYSKATGLPIPLPGVASKEDMQPLADEWQAPPFTTDFSPTMVNLWMGRCRKSPKESALHTDPDENLLLQVKGSKTFHMFPGHEVAHLHTQKVRVRYRQDPGPSGTTPVWPNLGPVNETQLDNFSPIDTVRPDFERYPKAKNAQFINCTVNEGEALWMPSYTWHNVISFGEPSDNPDDDYMNLAVNVWYSGEQRYEQVFVLLRDLMQKKYEAPAKLDDDMFNTIGYNDANTGGQKKRTKKTRTKRKKKKNARSDL